MFKKFLRLSLFVGLGVLSSLNCRATEDERRALLGPSFIRQQPTAISINQTDNNPEVNDRTREVGRAASPETDPWVWCCQGPLHQGDLTTCGHRKKNSRNDASVTSRTPGLWWCAIAGCASTGTVWAILPVIHAILPGPWTVASIAPWASIGSLSSALSAWECCKACSHKIPCQ